MPRTPCFQTAACLAASVALTVLAGSAHAALVGLWQFENDFTDSSSQGNNGAGINGVNFAASQAGFGQAGDFSGADTHVLVPHDPSLDITSTITIAAWVLPDGNAWEGILAKSPSNGSNNNHAGNYELRLENGSQNMTFLYQRGGSNDTQPVDSGVTVASNPTWTHIAVTMDGSTLRFYTNGTLANTVAAPATGFGATNTNPLYLGSRADLFTDFDGLLDDVAIFNEVLNDSQIATISTGDFTAFGVPEPSSAALLGLSGLALLRRRR